MFSASCISCWWCAGIRFIHSTLFISLMLWYDSSEPLLSPWSVHRTMQDLENPQVTSCNKGDQHYRSSPSNQSSSSDPGPCGSSGWSQQPGYDGYATTAVAVLFFLTYSFFSWREYAFLESWMQLQSVAKLLPPPRNFAKWRQFFPIWNDQNHHQCSFFPPFLVLSFPAGSIMTKTYNFAHHGHIKLFRAQKQKQLKENKDLFLLFLKCSLIFCHIQ